jgi:hypothetical protein
VQPTQHISSLDDEGRGEEAELGFSEMSLRRVVGNIRPDESLKTPTKKPLTVWMPWSMNPRFS